MKGSLDSVSKHSLILRFFRSLVIIGLAAAATFTAALPIMAAETIMQEAEGYFYIDKDYTGTPNYYTVGDTFTYNLAQELMTGCVINTNVQPGCTYTITYKLSTDKGDIHYTNDKVNLYSFTFSEALPGWDDILNYQYNSADALYSEFLTWNREVPTDGSYEYYTFSFSTAEGYVDNIEFGNLFVNFNFRNDILYGSKYTLEEISVNCVVDPSAEYFRNLVLGELTDAADKFEDASNALQEKEKEIMDKASGIYDSVSSDFHNYLADAKSFMSVATRSAASLGSAANVLTTSIYDPIISSLPAEVAVLFTVIPMLAFVAWLFGFSGSL